MSSSGPLPQPPQTRRTWLDTVIRLFSGIMGVAVISPAMSYLWPITRSGAGGSRKEVSGAEKMKTWEAKAEVVSGKPVIIVRKPNGFSAYSAVCTHLGCVVRWNEKKRLFECPCHAAEFDESGKVVAGPPPKPLSEYRVTQSGDTLFVES